MKNLKNSDIDVPVLVLGAGPAGLTATLLFGGGLRALTVTGKKGRSPRQTRLGGQMPVLSRVAIQQRASASTGSS